MGKCEIISGNCSQSFINGKSSVLLNALGMLTLKWLWVKQNPILSFVFFPTHCNNSRKLWFLIIFLHFDVPKAVSNQNNFYNFLHGIFLFVFHFSSEIHKENQYYAWWLDNLKIENDVRSLFYLCFYIFLNNRAS